MLTTAAFTVASSNLTNLLLHCCLRFIVADNLNFTASIGRGCLSRQQRLLNWHFFVEAILKQPRHEQRHQKIAKKIAEVSV